MKKRDNELQDRRKVATDAKTALLEKFRAAQSAPDREARQAERVAIAAAREERHAERLMLALKEVQLEIVRLEAQEALVDGFGVMSGRVKGPAGGGH